jgi:hypothetical protein
VLCTACGLKNETLHESHGAADGTPLRSPRRTPRKMASPPARQPLAALPIAAPLATPDSRVLRGVLAPPPPAEAQTPVTNHQGDGGAFEWGSGYVPEQCL